MSSGKARAVRAACAGLALACAGALAAAPPPPAAVDEPADLEQLVAPVALYPDPLLAQVLMAATYPLEIVEAARWVDRNPTLSGAALEAALEQEDWDASVKSLCGYPDVLALLDDNLDWAQDLGEAVLEQEAEVLAAIQRMRSQAYEAGELASGEQQDVDVQGDDIVIEPASDEVLYVAYWSPLLVYGGWTRPAWRYPALYATPAAGTGRLAFRAGVRWGSSVWGHCDWRKGDLGIAVGPYNAFVQNTSAGDAASLRATAQGRTAWKHSPEHRKGVNYRSRSVAETHSISAAQIASAGVSPGQARGRAPAATATPAAAATPAGSTRHAAGTAPAPSAAAHDAPGSALSGLRNPGLDRSASARGQASRSSASRSLGGRRGR